MTKKTKDIASAPVRQRRISSGKPATIRDVSRLADVSRVTVTRALAQPDLVKPETRARVLQAAAHLGYVPDRAAGSLATRRTGFIALVLPTLTNANFATLAHGLTDVLRRENFQLLITYNNYSLEEEEVQLRNLIARRPEAIVLTGTAHSRATRAMLMRSDVPIIEVADSTDRQIQHSIGFSNRQVGRIAAQFLLRRGFSRIGAIASCPQSDVTDFRGEARIQGFEEELQSRGLSTDLILRQGRAPVSFDHGAAAIRELLNRDTNLEAVFCVSDLSAVGVIMECGRHGVRVPEQLSVVGFGDFDIGRVMNPALTTIRVDFEGLGRRAGELALALLDGRSNEDCVSIDVAVALVERHSVAN